MSGRYPEIVYTEEGMREGMQRGSKVTAVRVGDPMGWCHPIKIEGIFGRVKERWPDITQTNQDGQ